MQNNITATPLIQSEQQPQSNKQKSEGCCISFFSWLFTICSWCFIIMIILILVPLPDSFESLQHDIRSIYIFIGLGLYVIYIIVELCSPTSRYLCNISNDGEGIFAKFGSFFRSVPSIILKCECYHTESETYTTTDSDGNTHTETRTYTVVTYRETINFFYYTCRDVSGLFLLNCDEQNISKKSYIKLELKEEINFADAVSFHEYVMLREDMRRRNQHRDESFALYEIKKIEGLKHHHLIKFQNNDPPCFGFWWFFLFTFLTGGQFYKWYVSSKCIYQNFTLRKLISTRYNLSSEEFNEKYERFNPQLNLITQQFTYEPNTYNFIQDIYKRPLPTEMEIENAKIFEKFIPKYEIYSGNEVGRAGTIKDIPGFTNFNDIQNLPKDNNQNNNINNNVNFPLNSVNINYQKDFTNVQQNNNINNNANFPLNSVNINYQKDFTNIQQNNEINTNQIPNYQGNSNAIDGTNI